MQEAHTQPQGPIYSPREGTFLLKYEAFVSGALTQSNCPAQIFHKCSHSSGTERVKKVIRIQQGNLAPSNNPSGDVQDLPRIFGELQDNLTCALPHNPVRQKRMSNKLLKLFWTASEASGILLRRS